MYPKNHKKLKLNGFTPIPPDMQFTALLLALLAVATITLLKEIL